MKQDIENKSFSELLQASFKSEDTEEWLDVHFTRPIGLVFALMWRRLGVHPNAITILSIFLGMGAACCFLHTELLYNIYGVILLMLANFCDSTDGQLARLTGQKTIIGRCLDGFAGDVWFFCIYLAIVIRLWMQPMPGTTMVWGFWGLAIAIVAGLLCHSPQSSLADYYRQIHLFFLKGRDGAEFNSSRAEQEYLEQLPQKGAFWERVFHSNYRKYCHSQEVRTPFFQRMRQKMIEQFQTIDSVPQAMKDEFLRGSRPLMPYTNILTFNTRAIALYIACLIDQPWLYLIFEITVMEALYIYMHHKHEHLCDKIYRDITAQSSGADETMPSEPQNPTTLKPQNLTTSEPQNHIHP